MNRRDLLALSAAALATPAGGAETAGLAYPEPGLRFVFQIDVALGPVQELGSIDGVRRRIIPIVGGTVHGPRLSGTVQPGGADWQDVRPEDGLTRVHAKYWLKADDGTVIGVDNRGVRRAPLPVIRSLMEGKTVPADAYYFRAAPFFDVGDGPHRWLNESLFICVGAREPSKAIIRIYEVT